MGNQNSSTSSDIASGPASTQTCASIVPATEESAKDFPTEPEPQPQPGPPSLPDQEASENGESEKLNELNIPTDCDSYDAADLVGLLFSEDAEDQPISKFSTIPERKVGQDSYTGQTDTSAVVSEPSSSSKSTTVLQDAESKKSAKKSVKIFTSREVRSGKVIGEGGFGRILQGSILGGIPVAIKFFHAPLPHTVVKAEVDALMTLKHQSIIQVYGIVEQVAAIDCPQLVLQFFTEGNLLQYLSRKENPDDASTLGKFALDVIEGCQYLHSRNIVHGNLAARNILIDKIVGRHKTFYNPKVSDMGIIHFVEPTGGNYVKVPGKEQVVPLRWVPKEIVEEQPDGSVGTHYTFASDVWSFGVTLWEIWTKGAIPYGASYSNMRVIQFLKDGFSPLKIHRPSDCPVQVVSVMESTFKVEPDERPSFDLLFEKFKTFKGFGRDNKLKSKGKVSPQTSTDKPNVKTSEKGAGGPPLPHKTTTPADGQLQEKIGKNKKKKNKKGKELPRELSNERNAGVEGASGFTSERSRREVRMEDTSSVHMHSSRNRHAQAGLGSNFNPVAEGMSDDPTIAALLWRVNQLERERNEQRRGGARRGALRGKRSGPGPPRFAGGYNEWTPEMDSSPPTPRPSSHRQSSLPPPSPTNAPPPYTEEPLPHHSSSPFETTSVARPDYEYASQIPGPSHRRGGSMSRGAGGGRDAGHSSRDDYLRKIRQLAEEIEVLRAEKMTQELLKKSAELASLMKHMAIGETEGEPRHVPSGPAPGPSHRSHYQGYDYDYSQTQSGWQSHHDEDFVAAPPQSSISQQQHQPSSRRPYYGRGPGRGRGFGKRGGGGGAASGGSMRFNPAGGRQ